MAQSTPLIGSAADNEARRAINALHANAKARFIGVDEALAAAGQVVTGAAVTYVAPDAPAEVVIDSGVWLFRLPAPEGGGGSASPTLTPGDIAAALGV